MEHMTYSVIIPVYNREQTLARCLDSLLSEKREDVQLILIDDGSKDRSGEICREYMAKHPNVEYYYQENAGVSAARNRGLSLARGSYVTFVDSDDYVAEGYFAALDGVPQCDLLAFGHCFIDGNGMRQVSLAQFQEVSQAQRLQLLLSSRNIMNITNKRFLRSIIAEHSLQFRHGLQVGEDFCFCMDYAMHCAKIGILDRALVYFDISGGNSLSRGYREKLGEKMCAVFAYVAEAIQNSPKPESEKHALLQIADYLFAKNSCTSLAEEFKKDGLSWPKDREKIHAICDGFRRPLTDGYVSFAHRGLRFLLRHRLDLPIYLVTWLIKGRG